MCTLMQLETLSSISKIDERIASKKSAKLNFTNLSPTSLLCLISKIKDDLKKYLCFAGIICESNSETT